MPVQCRTFLLNLLHFTDSTDTYPRLGCSWLFPVDMANFDHDVGKLCVGFFILAQ